jgi:hypothetical protein
VRDVSCKKCSTKLGWICEFATQESQRYKEVHVILERALISESEGFWWVIKYFCKYIIILKKLS